MPGSAPPRAEARRSTSTKPKAALKSPVCLSTPIGSTEVLLETPDLSAAAAKDESNELLTHVVATVSDGTGSASSRIPDEEEADDDTFVAEGPKVDSVKNTADGSSTGSINGGEELTITGSGFLVPQGATAEVEFLDAETSTPLEAVDVTPVSSTEIERDLAGPVEI